ncbi:putative GNAT family acetyltransferase [Staphylococcus piscifermentans]|uniref:Acetyltransferase n=1 Tax=Staphylococcus piscifermentans TaxID=70258 RepID=A0A239UFZ9_9STAP|nr:GNAT family N-acetyltransferase [Staphylococcus piscifermentans]RTX81876.1 GNAT family N-acetyltransferase [Staphylococcus piscifermentans]GEP85003.1 acetyltransferase [Staphylococcus piscifermentans]SNV08981.1 putative GNAT family acetyltransferase [Staphylococcus piscifermentans]
MEIRELALTDEAAFNVYIKSWETEQIVPTAINPKRYTSYSELVSELKQRTLIKEWVPNTTLFLFDNEKIIGAVNIRHYLNEHLKRIGGHIGYGVRPDYRRQGYAKSLLKAGLKFLNQHGVVDALVTCDKSNVASARTIIAFHPQELESAIIDGETVRRFLVSTDQ